MRRRFAFDFPLVLFVAAVLKIAGCSSEYPGEAINPENPLDKGGGYLFRVGSGVPAIRSELEKSLAGHDGRDAVRSRLSQVGIQCADFGRTGLHCQYTNVYRLGAYFGTDRVRIEYFSEIEPDRTKQKVARLCVKAIVINPEPGAPPPQAFQDCDPQHTPGVQP